MKSKKLLRVVCLSLCVNLFFSSSTYAQQSQHSHSKRAKLSKKITKLGGNPSDINYFEEDQLEDLYNSELVSISTTYYSVDDETGESKKLTDEQVDDLSLDKISNEDEFMEVNGSKMNNPKSRAGLVDWDGSKSSDGYLQNTMYLYSTPTKNVYNVSYHATWLKQPKNTKIDIAAIVWRDNCAIVKKSFNATRYVDYTVETYKYSFGKYKLKSSTVKKEFSYLNAPTKQSSTGVAYKYPLYKKSSTKKDNAQTIVDKIPKNQRIVISGKILLDDKNRTTIQAHSLYCLLYTSPSPRD